MQHIVDVRSLAEFQMGHAPGAINIPVDQLAIKLSSGLDMAIDADIIVYCAAGGRAGVAKTLLERAGYQRVTNAGGLSNMLYGYIPAKKSPSAITRLGLFKSTSY